MAPRTHLVRLTSLRFFAALAVVVSHIPFTLTPSPDRSPLEGLGATGVGFFFALSGFILTFAHNPADTRRRFYRKRFARVYPLHFATFLLAIPVLLIVGQEMTRREAITNLLLVQSWFPSPDIYFGMNAPSWSLSCEFLFYLIFPFLIPAIRRLRSRAAGAACVTALVLNVALAGSITALVGDGGTADFLTYIFPPARVLGFVAGCLLAQWMLTGRRFGQPAMLAAALLCAGYLVVAALDARMPLGRGIEDALLLPLVLFLIATAAQADLDEKPGTLRSRPLRLLGEWSFALYLTHWLLAILVSHSLPAAGLSAGLQAAADLIFVGVAVGISAVLYYAVERPLEKRLRGAPPRLDMVDAGPPGEARSVESTPTA